MNSAQQWFVVREGDHDAEYSYAAATPVAGPFASVAEANEYIAHRGGVVMPERAHLTYSGGSDLSYSPHALVEGVDIDERDDYCADCNDAPCRCGEERDDY